MPAVPSATPRLNMPNTHPILIDGQWRPATVTDTFTATDPRTRQPLPDAYPVSGWADLDAALAAAASTVPEMRSAGERIATFLDAYAAGIESAAEGIVAAAAAETGLAPSPRLRDVELPRTTGQLRQAATAAREGSWQRPTIDTKAGLRSCLAPLGVVWTIGPNNFPFAYNGIAGGDFAAALAAGCPVIAKGHPLHPTTTRLLAEAAHAAATSAGLPAGAVQMVYHLTPDDGRRLVADPRLAAVGFTGSRAGGLALKAAADAAGKPFFGEMSSLNPVVILPGAVATNADAIADQLAASVTLGTGQFCTKPGLVFSIASAATEAFVAQMKAKLSAAPAGVLFSAAGQAGLLKSIETVRAAGATVLAGGTARDQGGFGAANTLLVASGSAFMKDPHTFQTEAFGNATLLVVADDRGQLLSLLKALDGNLTGSVYSAADGSDDAAYAEVAAVLRPRVGRLMNDKMPTGVAVSPAQQHGGPYPASSQPHFTAVGMPTSIARFTQLEAYDNVRPDRLPPCLRDRNPTGRMWRMVDGNWTQADL
jgi:alpha-ketoglutaric semialdehyde dehydrogenase